MSTEFTFIILYESKFDEVQIKSVLSNVQCKLTVSLGISSESCKCKKHHSDCKSVVMC